MKFKVVAMTVGLLVALVDSAIPGSVYVLSLTDATSWPGGTASVTAHLDSNGGADIVGWSWGVCHDPAMVEVIEVVNGATVAALGGGAGPDFQETHLLEDGWVTSAVISYLSSEVLPPGSGYEMSVASYVSLAVGTTTLEFCGTLGRPPVAVVVAVPGAALPPATESGDFLSAEQEFFLFTAPEISVAYDPVCGEASFSTQVSVQDIFPPVDDTQGFSMGLSHDPATILDVESIEPTGVLATVSGGTGPEFFGTILYPEGWTAGVIYSFSGASPLAFDVPEPVITASYSTGGSLAGDLDGEFVLLHWTGTLGDPSVANAVLVDGQSIAPILQDGAVTLVSAGGGATPFIRGDCNTDGQYDIADAIAGLDALFGGIDPACPAACDSNGDASFDVADAVYLLAHVFSGGPPPPPPSSSCGADGGITCVFDACL